MNRTANIADSLNQYLGLEKWATPKTCCLWIPQHNGMPVGRRIRCTISSQPACSGADQYSVTRCDHGSPAAEPRWSTKSSCLDASDNASELCFATFLHEMMLQTDIERERERENERKKNALHWINFLQPSFCVCGGEVLLQWWDSSSLDTGMAQGIRPSKSGIFPRWLVAWLLSMDRLVCWQVGVDAPKSDKMDGAVPPHNSSLSTSQLRAWLKLSPAVVAFCTACYVLQVGKLIDSDQTIVYCLCLVWKYGNRASHATHPASLHWPSSLQKRQVIQLHRVSSIYIVLKSALIVKAQWPESRLEKVCEPQVEQFIHHSATSNLRSQVPVSVELSTTHKSPRLLHPFHLCCTFNSCLKGLATVDSIDATWCNMMQQCNVKVWCKPRPRWQQSNCVGAAEAYPTKRKLLAGGWKSQTMMKIWQEMWQICFECNVVSSYHDIMNHHR